jgi:methylated-DNA-[protein]-cysteine S-methyltransferase
MTQRTIDTPLGPMLATVENAALTMLAFDATGRCADKGPLLDLVESQLIAYFDGQLNSFDLPLSPRGTEFQQRVWTALQTVPRGETRSYGDIARQIGNPGAVRAVGGANGANPIAIVIPCHRVIASDGTLHGYAGGLDRKRQLLNLEAATLFA